MQKDIFHKAITVTDLDRTRAFYGELLGCATARRRNDTRSCDFDFFGNHLVCHLATGDEAATDRAYLAQVDYRHHHFGLVLDWDAWEALVSRLKQRDAAFMVEPLYRYVDEPREEALFMLEDPSGHKVEFKAFRQIDYLYRARA